MKGTYLRLWKKHAFDLGVVCIAGVLGFAFFLFLGVIPVVSHPVARFGLPSVDVILLVFPEDQRVAMAMGSIVGLVVVIGGYSEVSRARSLLGMALVTLGVVVAMAGLVALLLPHIFLLSTLNGPSPAYVGPGDRSWVDDGLWIVVALGLLVSALFLKRRQLERRVASSKAVVVIGLTLSVTAFSWTLLRVLASSEVLLEIGLGGQRLPSLTEKVLWLSPNGSIGKGLLTVCAGLFTWVGLVKEPFGTLPRYFSTVALAIFLLCCVILLFVIVPYYQACAAEVGT